MKRFTQVKGVLVRLAAAGVLLTGSLGMPCAAAAANQATTAKPAPSPQVPPPSENTVTAPVPFKGQKLARRLAPFTVILNASRQDLWPTQYSTLTAMTNQDVGPTPFYLSIYDSTSRTFIAICGTGTTCSVSVTHAKASGRYYYAYVSNFPTSFPPHGTQASTPIGVWINWKEVLISLQVEPATLYPDQTSTLTATTSEDIGPSPFWTSIYDATTGTRLVVCGYLTTCSVPVVQSIATTDRYIAYVSNHSTAYPPPGIQSTSNNAYVTWTSGAYRVWLTSTHVRRGLERLTAVTNIDVGPTPYWTGIYNLTTGARVMLCGSGTTCSVEEALSHGNNSLVAFLSFEDPALPPARIQANSSVVHVWFSVW